MDMITKALLANFAEKHELEALDESKQFEHLAAFVTISAHVDQSLDTDDVVVGDGSDGGIDAFGMLVNGTLIADREEFEDLASSSANLEVGFIFVQAERSPSFESAKIGTFGFGVLDFFGPSPQLKQNDAVKRCRELMKAAYSKSAQFKRGLPTCRMYYVTTGKWLGDPDLEARRSAACRDLNEMNLFSAVEFHPVDAARLRDLYQQTENAVTRTFDFANKAVLPHIDGVKEAYLGLIPAKELLAILTSADGSMTKSLYYDNVRDWQSYNAVNDAMRTTLLSDAASRFALMNNGITIIARDLRQVANQFTIDDFQIVNGCQTSHVVFDTAQSHPLADSVMVPLRLIVTQDEEVISAIIRATNSQTEVKPEQFVALSDFPKMLEAFFQSIPAPYSLYYERRSRQYHGTDIEKTRVVTQAALTRAFAAMFIGEPHTVARTYSVIRERLGITIFGKDHQPMPYYTAAYALYRLEYLFRRARIDPRFKPARYHILYAFRLLAHPEPLPKWMNSKEMERYCGALNVTLWDSAASEAVFVKAADAIASVAGASFDRDSIRTHSFTQRVELACGVVPAAHDPTPAKSRS